MQLIALPLPQTFAALGEPTRFAIVQHLLAAGEQPVSALRGLADISAPALSRHLKVLHGAGLVSRRIDAQRRIYAVRPEAVRAISDWAISYRSFWQGSLDRLAANLDRDLQ